MGAANTQPSLPPNSREDNGVSADTDITTLVAVTDLAQASDFYETKLHLAKVRQEPGWIQYRTGASDLIVYKSQQYDNLFGTTRDGDIHHAGPVKMAWFKDPSGNTFGINGR